MLGTRASWGYMPCEWGDRCQAGCHARTGVRCLCYQVINRRLRPLEGCHQGFDLLGKQHS